MPSDLASAATTDRLRPHHQWRPDWAQGRACLYWYLTFERQAPLTALWRETRPLLRRVPAVDVVPRTWLHLTMVELGFVDAVSAETLSCTIRAVRPLASATEPLELRLGPATTMADAVVLPVRPNDSLTVLRQGLVEASPGRRRRRDAFWPHVSIGYLNRSGDRREIMHALDPVASRSAAVTVPTLTLASVSRRSDHYRWETVARLRLGRGAGLERREPS